VAGCGDDDGGGGAADAAIDAAPDATPDAAACEKLWTRLMPSLGGTASMGIEGGALTLRASGSGGIAARQSGITTGFDVSVEFEGFVSGGTGSYAQLIVTEQDPAPARFIVAGIGSDGVTATMFPGVRDTRPTTGSSGTLRIRKVGNQFTVTATSGGVTATVTDFYGVTPLDIALQVGTTTTLVSGETSIRFTDFRATMVGTVPLVKPRSDSFDCDSLF